MESLRLEGPTIRGVVQGRPVNCIVRSVPDGLALPSGQYCCGLGRTTRSTACSSPLKPRDVRRTVQLPLQDASCGIEKLARRSNRHPCARETGLQRDLERGTRRQDGPVGTQGRSDGTQARSGGQVQRTGGQVRRGAVGQFDFVAGQGMSRRHLSPTSSTILPSRSFSDLWCRPAGWRRHPDCVVVGVTAESLSPARSWPPTNRP